MKYLLDTHTFIWLDGASTRLSPKVRALIADRDNTLLLSLVSVWEIQIKHQLGKLNLRSSLAGILEDQRQKNQLEMLSITLQHILELETLPGHHRDPFDRLLVAQAKVEGATLFTDDPQIARYSVPVVW